MSPPGASLVLLAIQVLSASGSPSAFRVTAEKGQRLRLYRAPPVPGGGKTLPSFILTSKPFVAGDKEEEVREGQYFLETEKPKWEDEEEPSYVIECSPGKKCQQIISFEEKGDSQEEEEDDDDNDRQQSKNNIDSSWEIQKRYSWGDVGKGRDRYEAEDIDRWDDGRDSWENVVGDVAVAEAVEQRIRQRNKYSDQQIVKKKYYGSQQKSKHKFSLLHQANGYSDYNQRPYKPYFGYGRPHPPVPVRRTPTRPSHYYSTSYQYRPKPQRKPQEKHPAVNGYYDPFAFHHAKKQKQHAERRIGEMSRRRESLVTDSRLNFPYPSSALDWYKIRPRSTTTTMSSTPQRQHYFPNLQGTL